MYKAMVAGWVAGLVAGWVAGWPAGRKPPPPLAGAAPMRAWSVHNACVQRAQCVRAVCTVRACSVHSWCVRATWNVHGANGAYHQEPRRDTLLS